MSLIINMLKDLEKREKPHREMPDIALTHQSAAIQSYMHLHFSTRRIAIISLIIMAVAIALLLFTMLHQTKPILVPILATSTAPLTQTNSSFSENDTWLKQSKINGVALQTNNNITEIRFLLDHATLYRIASDRNGNHLLITFENSQLQSQLPLLDYLNTGIRNISTIKTDTGIQFDITLNPGVIINNVSMDNQRKGAELNLQININPPLANDGKNITSELIRTPVSQDMLVQQYQSALALAQAGDKNSAIDRLNVILKNNQQYHQARASLIALMIESGNYFKSEKVLSEGLKLAPNYIPFTELKARLLTLKGDVDGAIALLQLSMPSIDDYPDYYAFMAALYERKNRNTSAANIYKQLLKVDSQNGNWWFGLALSLDKLGNQKEAAYSYSRAMSKGQLNTSSLAYLQQRLHILQEATHETD